jgi:hypothetical protein
MKDFKDVPIKKAFTNIDSIESLKAFPDPDKRFSGPLVVGYVDGDQWMLDESLSYRTKAGEICTARKGFIFDFASIPWWLGWLYPKTGDGSPYGIGSLFHDWLYCHRKIGGRTIERIEADNLFYEINVYVGVSRWTAGRMRRAVRAFGWIPWGQRKPEDIIP